MASAANELFEAAWKAYPHIRGRSSKAKTLGYWRKLAQPIREKLPAACRAYAAKGAEPKADCGAPAMDRWVRDERFVDWLEAERPTAPVELTPAMRAWAERRHRETGEWRSEWGPKPELTQAEAA